MKYAATLLLLLTLGCVTVKPRTLKPESMHLICTHIWLERYVWSAPGFLGRWIHSRETVFVPFFEECTE